MKVNAGMSTIPPAPPTLEEQLWQSHQAIKKMRRRRRWLWLFLILSVMLNAWYYGMGRLHHEAAANRAKDVFSERFLSGDEDAADKIAVIRVQGLISSEIDGEVGVDGMVGDIRKQFELAERDEAVKAIILRVDSPGGEILAADEIYRTVRKMRGQKPVICSMGSLAASGGYYVALGSKWIIADELTITGSIGVIIETLNYKGLMDKVGLETVVFKSGKFKDILNGDRKPTPEEMALMQRLVDESYEKFLGLVARERKLDPVLLKKDIADGRIFSGKQALSVKLIDAVGTFEDAVKKAREEAHISEAKVFDYVAPFSFRNLLSLFAKAPPARIQVEFPSSLLRLKPGKLYYLSAHLF
jgi:protease-4